MVTKIIRALKKIEDVSEQIQSGNILMNFAGTPSSSSAISDCIAAGGPASVVTTHDLKTFGAYNGLIKNYTDKPGHSLVQCAASWSEISSIIGTEVAPIYDYIYFLEEENQLSYYGYNGIPPTSYIDFSACLFWGINGLHPNSNYIFTMAFDTKDTVVINASGGYYDFSNEHP